MRRLLLGLGFCSVLWLLPIEAMAQDAACGISFEDGAYDSYDDVAVVVYESRVLTLGYVPTDIQISEGHEAYAAEYFDEAFVIYQALALKGDAAGYYYMGRLYEEGNAPNGRDEEAATELYELAAREGNLEAELQFLSRGILGEDAEIMAFIDEIGGAEDILARAGNHPQALFLKGAEAHLAGDNSAALPFLELSAMGGEGVNSGEENQGAMILLARIYCNDYEALDFTIAESVERAETWWGRLNRGAHRDEFTWVGFTCDAVDELSEEEGAIIRERVLALLDDEILEEVEARDAGIEVRREVSDIIEEGRADDTMDLGYGERQIDGQELVLMPVHDE